MNYADDMEFIILIIISFFNSILEFLPVSSTLHTTFFFNLFKLRNLEQFLVFSQLGITLSLCIFYRKLIFEIMKGFFTDKKIRIFCYKIVFLCAISGVLGIILLNLIKNIRYNLNLAAFSLVALGFIMIFIEKTNKTVKGVNDIKNITWRQNLYIGFIQALSLIPGVSRSGATVCGGLQNGLDKKTAVKYSFFISIPINIMSCVFDVYKNYDIMLNQGQLIALLVFMFNFIFSLFFIKKALEFFEKINLKFFGYYRILVALIIFLTLR